MGQQIQITTWQGRQLDYDIHGKRRGATGFGRAVNGFYTNDDENERSEVSFASAGSAPARTP